MDKGENYEVKDLKLAEQGELNIELAENNMGALLKVKERFKKEKPLKGIRIGLALHVTKEKIHIHEQNGGLIQKVRKKHLQLAKEFGWKIVNANQSREKVFETIQKEIDKLLA